MKLDEFLAVHSITERRFGCLIDVSQTSVNRYRSGHRVPRSSIMRRIAEATHGLVTPNDFFPPVEAPPTAPEAAG